MTLKPSTAGATTITNAYNLTSSVGASQNSKNHETSPPLTFNE